MGRGHDHQLRFQNMSVAAGAAERGCGVREGQAYHGGAWRASRELNSTGREKAASSAASAYNDLA